MASYNHTQYSEIKHSPDHVYYDLVSRSYASNVTDVSVPITFSDTRSAPIIDDISQYQMSIIRFQVDTFTELLPVLFFQTAIGTTDRNEGVYRIVLRYDDTMGTTLAEEEPLLWSPQIKDAPIPPPPSTLPGGLQSNTSFYYCYNFEYFIGLINEAFERAMTRLRNALPFLDGKEAPFLVWQNNQTARLYAREDTFNSDKTTPYVSINFNRSLYSVLSSLPSIKGVPIDTNRINPAYFQILVRPWNGVRVVNVEESESGIHKLIYVDQEYSTIDQFTPVASISFTTATIPILPTFQSNPQVIIDGQPNKLTNTYDKFANVITDISADFAYKSSILYNPQSEFRMIDMSNNKQPLNTIDIQVYWQDKLGFHHPLNLSPNSSVSLKIMFRKKNYKK
jgi:hypothetical protein